jgi:hypothetical protein
MPLAPTVSPEEINLMVQNAATEERRKMEELYSARLANFKDRLDADYQAKMLAALRQSCNRRCAGLIGKTLLESARFSPGMIPTIHGETADENK